MTRKDYELMAYWLNLGLNLVSAERDGSDRQFDIGYRSGYSYAVAQLCAALKNDNPKFNPVKFSDAVTKEG